MTACGAVRAPERPGSRLLQHCGQLPAARGRPGDSAEGLRERCGAAGLCARRRDGPRSASAAGGSGTPRAPRTDGVVSSEGAACSWPASGQRGTGGGSAR